VLSTSLLAFAPTLAEDAQSTNAADSKTRPETLSRDAAAKNTGSSIKYVTRQSPTDWSAQALIGRNVENPSGETLGDINNVILNEKGDVVAVTIGVGGFLGIGEKDVGVPFDSLEFRAAEAVEERDTANPSKEERVENQREQAEDAREARYDSEHENVEIVLNATREQLETVPSFVWLDQQDASGKRSERSAE
jgi:hypothetical protein